MRHQLAAQQGGADAIFDNNGQRVGGARMTVVVSLHPSGTGRLYRVPNHEDYLAVYTAQTQLAQLLTEWECVGRDRIPPIPNEPLPLMSGTFNVPLYGMNAWGDLFTARQKIALSSLIEEVHSSSKENDNVKHALASLVARSVDKYASLVVWNNVGEKVEHVFGRQATANGLGLLRSEHFFSWNRRIS